MVCRSVELYSERLRLDEESVPYGVLGERVAEEGLPRPRADEVGMVMLNPLLSTALDSVVVELERESEDVGWPAAAA